MLLAAEFVAATQVLVYIGAIVVLFLFGVDAHPGPDRRRSSDLTNRKAVLGGLATAACSSG